MNFTRQLGSPIDRVVYRQGVVGWVSAAAGRALTDSPCRYFENHALLRALADQAARFIRRGTDVIELGESESQVDIVTCRKRGKKNTARQYLDVHVASMGAESREQTSRH